MGYIYNWSEIIEYVLRLPHQQNVLVPKKMVIHPQTVSIPYSWDAHRKPVPDGRAIDIKERPDYYLIHWDKYNPSTQFIKHVLYDTLGWWILSTISPTCVLLRLIVRATALKIKRSH